MVSKLNCLMDRLIRPPRLDLEPTDPNATDEYTHWWASFEACVRAVEDERNRGASTTTTLTDQQKLDLLISLVSPKVYKMISKAANFKEAKTCLEEAYASPPNVTVARHQLLTRRQQAGESVSTFMRELVNLSHKCHFKDLKADEARLEYVRDAFIVGLLSPAIRQRLLEDTELTHKKALDIATTLERAQNDASGLQMLPSQLSVTNSASVPNKRYPPRNAVECGRCGGKDGHGQENCPALSRDCGRCGKKGHYARKCRSKPNNRRNTIATTAEEQHENKFSSKSDEESSDLYPFCSAVCSLISNPGLGRATVPVKVNGRPVHALLDTGATGCFIDKDLAGSLKLSLTPNSSTINLASRETSTTTAGCATIHLELKDLSYQVSVEAVNGLCAPLILGQTFFNNHESCTFNQGGPRPPLLIDFEDTCAVTVSKVDPPVIFGDLSPDVRPIVTKSRNHSEEDNSFIAAEVAKLLKEGIIEPSSSPWRAQVLVTKSAQGKKRMVVDYSRTVNRYTLLDTYPLPKLDEQVKHIAKGSIFSTLDLRSAYYQIELRCMKMTDPSQPLKLRDVCTNIEGSLSASLTVLQYSKELWTISFQRTT